MREYQSALESFLEAAANTLSGFFLAYLTWLFVIPKAWMIQTAGNAFKCTLVFTVVSLLRSFVWRRFFEQDIHKKIHLMVSLLKRPQ